MDEQTFYDNLFELSPPYPLNVLEFLKTELQLGKKYVVMDIHSHNAQMSKLLTKHVHLVCSLSTDPGYFHYLKTKLSETPNFLSLNATPELISVEDDSIDCICIDETFAQYDVLRMGIEFERILRLNSYVLIIQNQLERIPNSFSNDFQQFITSTYPMVRIGGGDSKAAVLKDFYNHTYQQKIFPNQQRLNLEGLKKYFLTLLLRQQITGSPQDLQYLEELFEKYQKEGEVVLEYKTSLYYGLFNYSVPEISLRKSIFFNVLRPIAFGFYVLVKANIYFWRALYKVKDKLFPSHRSR